MLGFVRTVIWPSKRLPDDIFGELVDIIFTSLPPVALIGVTLVTCWLFAFRIEMTTPFFGFLPL